MTLQQVALAPGGLKAGVGKNKGLEHGAWGPKAVPGWGVCRRQ